MEPRYMITRDPKSGLERICLILEEDEDNYIGNWVYGFGGFRRKFSKELTRPLTRDEVDNYNSFKYRAGRLIPFQLDIAYDGTIRNPVKNKSSKNT